MPYQIIKLPKKDLYKVINKETKRVIAKHTTKEKALKQIRLLNYIDHFHN